MSRSALIPCAVALSLLLGGCASSKAVIPMPQARESAPLSTEAAVVQAPAERSVASAQADGPPGEEFEFNDRGARPAPARPAERPVDRLHPLNAAKAKRGVLVGPKTTRVR